MDRNDLISRQAAIEAPEKYIKDCNPEHFVGHQKFIEYMDNAEIGSFGNWQFANGFNMGLTAAEVAIKKLPSAQPEQQWIPCSERLPEEDVDALITCRFKDGEGDTSHAHIYITTYGQMYFGGNKVGDHKHWRAPFEYFESNYEVIAWMPLPEPYKEGERDEE